MRSIFSTTAFFLLSPLAAFAGSEGAHASLPLQAETIWPGVPITNSMVMVWMAVAIITLFCRAATKRMALVPAGFQNFAEWVVESLYDFLTGILGAYMVKKTFWFFASIFLLIFVTNWLGILPGVGTIGRLTDDGGVVWLLRGGNADVNMTMAMSVVFALLWCYWAVAENGVVGVLKHIFAPQGDFKGVMLALMVPIFFFVGVLEVISIAIRPVALTFRLFGNIYGGEQTMEKLMELTPKPLAFLPALPFYFMELLVGFIQAFVFMLLTAVFVRLICEHAGEKSH